MAQPFMSFVHPDDLEATMREAARLASPGGAAVVGFENRYRTRDGGYRSIEWAGVAEDGVYYFAAQDVTERHEADRLSRHSEALLRTLMANLPDTSVFLIDHDLRILVADGEMIRQLGMAGRGHVPRTQGDRALRGGARRGARAVAATTIRPPWKARAARSSSSARG